MVKDAALDNAVPGFAVIVSKDADGSDESEDTGLAGDAQWLVMQSSANLRGDLLHLFLSVLPAPHMDHQA